jgi:hypothetical protein
MEGRSQGEFNFRVNVEIFDPSKEPSDPSYSGLQEGDNLTVFSVDSDPDGKPWYLLVDDVGNKYRMVAN